MCGHVIIVVVSRNDHKMALIELGSTEEAIGALIVSNISNCCVIIAWHIDCIQVCIIVLGGRPNYM